MVREKAQAPNSEAESTNGLFRDGPDRSSVEALVVRVERRIWAIQISL